MLRIILAIVLAPVFWGIIMFPLNQLIFLVYPEMASGTPLPPIGYLLMALGASILCSLFAGYCSAHTAGTSASKVGLGAGLLILAVGIFVEIQYWDQLPLWYHLTFLVMLLPATIFGTRLQTKTAATKNTA